MNDKTEKLKVADLMNLLVSKKRDEYVAAVHEIVRRGETMFDSLLKLKGNKDIFHGAVYLGYHSPSNVVYMPLPEFLRDKSVESYHYDENDQFITVEVTALWLVSAIYFQRTDFSESALLMDLSIESSEANASNNKENVERAYQSVEKWIEKCRREGISSLREKKIDPLAGSNLKWW